MSAQATLSKWFKESRTPIELAAATLVGAPFRYAVIAECLDAEMADCLLAWFEEAAPWHLIETDFYQQYEFNLWDTPAPEAGLLTSSATVSALREDMGALFGLKFEERVDMVAHKLTPGQRIAIHNDYRPSEETHRLVVQLNHRLSDDDGGFLMLFNSDNPRDVHHILRPAHLSGLAFEISARSFHAVSRIHGHVRYSVVFSLYADNGHPHP